MLHTCPDGSQVVGARLPHSDGQIPAPAMPAHLDLAHSLQIPPPTSASLILLWGLRKTPAFYRQRSHSHTTHTPVPHGVPHAATKSCGTHTMVHLDSDMTAQCTPWAQPPLHAHAVSEHSHQHKDIHGDLHTLWEGLSKESPTILEQRVGGKGRAVSGVGSIFLKK